MPRTGKEILSTPNISAASTNAGTFSVLARATIKAMPEEVWLALIDFPKYPVWNTFTPGAAVISSRTGSLAVGDRIKLSVSMTGGSAWMALQMEITSLDNQQLSWKNLTFPSFLLRAERVFEIKPGATGTEFRCYETQTGPLAPIVNLFCGRILDKAFERFVQDIKRYVETSQ